MISVTRMPPLTERGTEPQVLIFEMDVLAERYKNSYMIRILRFVHLHACVSLLFVTDHYVFLRWAAHKQTDKNFTIGADTMSTMLWCMLPDLERLWPCRDQSELWGLDARREEFRAGRGGLDARRGALACVERGLV